MEQRLFSPALTTHLTRHLQQRMVLRAAPLRQRLRQDRRHRTIIGMTKQVRRHIFARSRHRLFCAGLSAPKARRSTHNNKFNSDPNILSIRKTKNVNIQKSIRNPPTMFRGKLIIL